MQWRYHLAMAAKNGNFWCRELRRCQQHIGCLDSCCCLRWGWAESNVGHHTLDGNLENWLMGLGMEPLDIIEKNDGFLFTSTTSTSISGRGATRDTSNWQGNACSIGGDGNRLKDLLPNALLACLVEVGIVGGGKILALLWFVLLLLLFGMDTLDRLLGIICNARITCVGALDDPNTIFQKCPWVRPATTIATKWESSWL